MEEPTLEARVARLEAEVARLSAQLAATSPAPGAARLEHPLPRAARPAPAPAPPELSAAQRAPLGLRDWLDKVGIGLLLVGVLFLLKYTHDQGWVGERGRLLMALSIGLTLLLIGIVQRHARRHLAAVLMGGGLAVSYGVVVAAHAAYGLLPLVGAFGALIALTVGGSALALMQGQSVLASLAAIGAFVTPFALMGEATTPLVLAGYAAMAVMGFSVVYARRGWPSLLLTTSFGASVALMAAQGLMMDEPLEAVHKPAVTAIALTIALIQLLTPALAARVMRAARLGALEAWHGLAVVSVLYGWLSWAWAARPMLSVAALMALGGAAALAAALARRAQPTSAWALGAASAAALGLAMGLGMGLNQGAQALLVIGLCSHGLGRHVSPTLRVGGYMSTLGLLAWGCYMLALPVDGLALLNPAGFQLLLAVASVGLMGLTFEARGAQRVHLWGALLALLAVLAHQLQALSYGALLTTCVWGAVAMSAIVVGLRLGSQVSQVMGLVIIVGTGLKLLVFDLEQVAAIWRVGLFMLFGVTLLGLSALWPRLTGAPWGDEADEATPGGGANAPAAATAAPRAHPREGGAEELARARADEAP